MPDARESHKYIVPALPDELKFARTEREKLYLAYIKQLLLQVKQDFLTGLEHKEEFQSKLKEQGEKGIFIFIDSDGLKKMNDTLGHAAGTAAILATADGIKKALREKDHASVSRYGGDEFVVHIADASLSTGVAIAKRILDSIHRQNIAHFYDGDDKELKSALSEVSLKASLGVGRTQEDADRALYVAKSRGRDRVEFTTPGEESTNHTATLVSTKLTLQRISNFVSPINRIRLLKVASKL